MEFLSKLDKINRELIPFIIPFLFISYLKMQKKKRNSIEKTVYKRRDLWKRRKGWTKKKKNLLYRVSPREKIRFPFLRISCSLARGEIKENWENYRYLS